MRLGIYGCGGFGREVLQWFRDSPERAFCNPVFIDDGDDDKVMGVEVISAHEFASFYPNSSIVIAVGDPMLRKSLAEKMRSLKIMAGYVTHRTAITSLGSSRGAGSIMCPHTILSPNAKVGYHCHMNIYSYVAHDAVVGDFVTLSPKACVNGNCRVDDGAFIGTGAVLREGVHIGANAVIGAGAAVVKDVPPGETWVGVPARPVKKAG